tara:strand:+ start:22 stop:171 length:150 start_codon:yes stop_codon:yes gene_type:complete
MTKEQEKMLIEVHGMLTDFTKLYNKQIKGKVVSFSNSPDPTDEPCPVLR